MEVKCTHHHVNIYTYIYNKNLWSDNYVQDAVLDAGDWP